MTASPLRGHRVLVPRTRPGDPIAAAVRAAGAEPVPTALVRHAVADPAELDAALRRLAAGAYAWLAVTSATTVEVLADRAARLGTTLGGLTRGVPVAAVGPATARALDEAGVAVALTPPGESSAATLAAAWPAGHGRVLFPRSEIAGPTLATALRERGWDVDDVVAYRTMPAEKPDPAVAADLAAGRIDLVLLTSGSTARALAGLYGAPAARVCAIGAATASAAAAAGLPVHAVAEEQTPAGLVAAAARALTTTPQRSENR
ncbi:uroporphyrinogen-III synthase [Georgenia sp. AZ-5]|uniref:uroporphyrinogen-III synthase n=1 Tax=Georgenia sp. AZ-5 TaxID=3367526 RepID=UPI0037551248